MDLQDSTKFEPGRPVFVLIHKDHTHIQGLPNGEPDWSYNKADMQLRLDIMRKDFGGLDRKYYIENAAEALRLIANKQAELIKAWTPTINLIRKAPTRAEKRTIYDRFAKRTKLPHPVEADGLLRKLLGY